MTEFTKEQVRRFANNLQESYSEQTDLHDISNHVWYNEKKHSNADFVQFARRIKFPVEIIEDGILGMNAQRLVSGFATSEVRMIVEKYEEQASNNAIETLKPNDLTMSDFANATGVLSQPDTIYIPYNYEGAMYKLFSDSIIGSKKAGEYLKIGSDSLKIIWLIDDHGVDDIYIAPSEHTRIVQKRMSESDLPEDINEKYVDWVPKEALMVYFGDEVYQDPNDKNFPRKIDLLYRIVCTEPILGSDPAVKIDMEQIRKDENRFDIDT